MIKYFLLYISPYLVFTGFLVGLSYKLYKWLSAPKGAPAPIYPRASKSPLRKAIDYVFIIATFKPLYDIDKRLWLASWTSHLGLLMFTIGHFRLLTEFTPLWNILGLDEKGIELFAFVSGGIAGLMFMIPLFYLLYRRFTPLLRKLSVFEDYFAILLVLALAVTGNYMRFFEHVDVEALRRYFIGLITLNPIPLTYDSPLFLAHYALAQLFLIYFPFSKLFHALGAFVSNAVLFKER